ncbi:hypothetical protein ABZP36_028313 [Zizania latifolia]
MGNCTAPSLHADDGELVPPELEREREERAGVEVRIRISKRQLQELLEKAAATVTAAAAAGDEVVLAGIINAGEVVDRHHRHWRPALQSIPEAIEP